MFRDVDLDGTVVEFGHGLDFRVVPMDATEAFAG